MAAKILLFIETGGPGGAERVVAALAAGLAAEGLDVGVLTLRTGWLTDTLTAQGTRHHQLESRRGADPALPFRIAALIRQERYQVLHTHLLDSNFYGSLAARIAGVPHVATEHGDVHHINKKRFATLKLKIVSVAAGSISAVSEFSRKQLIELGVSARKVSVIGNPINNIETDSEVRAQVRAGLGVQPEDWLWLHAANLRPVKDQKTLLRGFAESLSLSPVPQRLLIAGDGPERAGLETLAAELGIADRVMFLGFRNDVQGLLQAADGFILSSLSEAMPMSLLEAASSGLVLIGSAVGGIPEVIKDGETGYLFPAGDHQSLGRVIAKALSDRPAAAQLAERGRREVLHKFSLQTVLAAYKQLYKLRP